MKMYQKLTHYALGQIKAEGFIADQMARCKDGMGGHLYELEPGMIRDPFIDKKYVPLWGDGDQSGWGAEISGNYWTGYIQLAFTLNDKEMIDKATWWADHVIAKQRPDGYLGTYYEEDADKYDDYNGWGTRCMLRGLFAFYEATGRKEVLDACHRCLLWFCDNWTGDHKTGYGGPKIIESMVQCYSYTGDTRLIDFCNEYMDFLERHDVFKKSCSAMLDENFYYLSDHAAGVGSHTKVPAILYSATGNERYLKATENRIKQVRAHSIQLTGGAAANTEYAAPVGPITETEYCSFAFYNETYSIMSYVTGEAKYGDYIEEIFYNGAQGSRKKDEKAIAYMSSPNQIFATKLSSNTIDETQVYAPCYPVACCPVNAVAILADFVRAMLLRDDEENVYAAAYGPCSLDAGKVKFKEETLYPFRNNVKFNMLADAEFTMFLKIPQWAKGYEITVNGEKASAKENGLGYAGVRREWKNGDVLEIKFTAKVEVVTVDDSDGSSKFPLAIRYGALLYALHIPEVWTKTKQREGTTPLPEGWSWYEANPYFEEADVPDAHERMGLRRYQFCWNVALDPDLKPEDIEVEERDVDGYVWENAPTVLHTTCYRAPYLTPVYATRTHEPFEKDQFVTEKLSLTLEPFGCTNLRISYFPRARKSCIENIRSL